MARTYVGLALLLGLSAGCNAILGLDEVVPRGSGGGGVGAGPSVGGGTSVGGGGTGGGAVCPDPTPETIIDNGSFADTGSWVTAGDFDFTIENAQDCALACGDSVGHFHTATTADASVGIYQDFLTRLDLGGKLTLNGRYDHNATTHQPYFLLISNGYDIGLTSFIKGNTVNGVYVVDDYEQVISDPRRTGNGGTIGFVQDFDAGQEAEDWIDCVSLKYEPPPGVEALMNGWFDSGISSWTPFNGATNIAPSANGLCSPTAGQVTIAPDGYGEVRNVTAGTWPVGTRFVYGGAVAPVNANAPMAFELFLRIEYADTTYDLRNVGFSSDSEIWKYASSEYVVPKTVSAIGLAVAVDNNDVTNPQDFLLDCLSMRAIAP